MPVSPRRFGHQNVTFPRDVNNMFIFNPINNLFQENPITRGATIIALDGSTDHRKSPKTFSAPIKSVTTGGIRGLRIRS